MRAYVSKLKTHSQTHARGSAAPSARPDVLVVSMRSESQAGDRAPSPASHVPTRTPARSRNLPERSRSMMRAASPASAASTKTVVITPNRWVSIRPLLDRDALAVVDGAPMKSQVVPVRRGLVIALDAVVTHDDPEPLRSSATDVGDRDARSPQATPRTDGSFPSSAIAPSSWLTARRHRARHQRGVKGTPAGGGEDEEQAVPEPPSTKRRALEGKPPSAGGRDGSRRNVR